MWQLAEVMTIMTIMSKIKFLLNCSYELAGMTVDLKEWGDGNE